MWKILITCYSAHEIISRMQSCAFGGTSIGLHELILGKLHESDAVEPWLAQNINKYYFSDIILSLYSSNGIISTKILRKLTHLSQYWNWIRLHVWIFNFIQRTVYTIHKHAIISIWTHWMKFIKIIEPLI